MSNDQGQVTLYFVSEYYEREPQSDDQGQVSLYFVFEYMKENLYQMTTWICFY